jgi:hypothetical protein
LLDMTRSGKRSRQRPRAGGIDPIRRMQNVGMLRGAVVVQ